jgi:PAS domain S-box-containing protein
MVDEGKAKKQSLPEHRQTEESLQQRSRQLAALNRASHALSSTLDLDQVLIAVLEELRGLLEVTASSVWLLDHETGELVCRQATGPQSEIVRGWRLMPGEGLAGWVAGSGENLIVSDIRTDERHTERVDQETGLNLRSVLSVPMRAQQKMIGVLQVVDAEPDRFDEDDLELLEPLATAAAIAIENARLYQEADELRAFNETIVLSLEEGILLEDASGEFAFANPKAAALLDYTVDELVERRWADILSPGQSAELEGDEAKQPLGEAIRYETVLLTKNGRSLPVIVSARTLYEHGRLVGVLSAFTDITARKRVEEELRQTAEELVRSNADLDQFARVASHDLQEPLRTVKGQLELLEQLTKGGPDSDVEELIAYALESVDRMRRMINDLLAYSRVGKQEGKLEPVDCDVVLEQTLANLQFAIEESDAKITSDPLPIVMVDATQLNQLLQNLISNAIKYRSAEPPSIHVSAEQQEGEYHFSVKDNGVGIFQRSHEGQGKSGTGLGLAICKRIVERHGGRIWVESHPEKGSTFYFSLPIRSTTARG